MHGAGWYGWQNQPWNVGALDLWYLTMRPDDRMRVGENDWVEYLQGGRADYPETALRRDLASVAQKTVRFRADATLPERRLADNMLNSNPASITALTHLMQGGLIPGRDGGILFARLRYFDPEKRRAGVPPDVAALVSELTDRTTVVTLINVGATDARTVIVQGGAFGEHQIESVEVGGRKHTIGAGDFSVKLASGSPGETDAHDRAYQVQSWARR